jgi:hypothetical protein
VIALSSSRQPKPCLLAPDRIFKPAVDDWWKDDPERGDKWRGDPLKDYEWNDEMRKAHEIQAQLIEFIEYALRFYSREQLLKLKADHRYLPGFEEIIDDHLANRFWKMGDDAEDGEAGKLK